MKLKSITVLTLVLSGATAGFSQIALNTTPSRSLGQPALAPVSANPNLVEGREMYEPQGLALDTSVTPPIIYVADYLNNRVLAWKSATGFTNGQPADLILGQPTKFSTAAGGPGTSYTTGFYGPTGLAVLNGDLYVADSNNNRILRFKKPFNTANPLPDLWLGQPSLNSRVTNFPTGVVSDQGLSLAGSQVGLAFDSSNNLWVVDPGNNRVLEFSASDVANGGGSKHAILELGQLDFSSLQKPLVSGQAQSGVIGNEFATPTNVAFDPAGQLYVSDGSGTQGFPLTGRVLVFTPPFSNGMTATRIVGVFSPVALQTPGAVTQALVDNTQMASPNGMFFLQDGSLGVVDTGFNRILIFPPFSSWPNQNVQYSPSSVSTIGQNYSFSIKGPNNSQSTTLTTPPATGATLYNPSAAVFSPATSELYVADSANNRVVVIPQKVGAIFQPNATRVLGQDTFTGQSANLIEGREFQFNTGIAGGQDAGIAIDSTGSVPHLYVSDPYNHRVLGFADARKIQPGTKADLVIGQPPFSSGAYGLCNYPTGDSTQPTQSSLCTPKGLLVDSSGNLYVADSGNGRVLRFPAPFANQTPGKMEQADLVLGQQSFTLSVVQTDSATMGVPYGLAFSGTNGLLVSDQRLNRVLYIPFTGNGTFKAGTDNGRAATKVFGQNTFTTSASGTSTSNLNAPHHVASDSNGLIYVADSANNRVLIFSDPNNGLTSSGAPAVLAISTGLNAPLGIYVNSTTGEIWVTNTNSGTALRYPKFESLQFNPAPTVAIPGPGGATLAVAQDQFNDLYIADGTNTVSVYYPSMFYQNAASFEVKPLAPAMYASLYGQTLTQFGSATASAANYPLPATLANVQVTVNGVVAPLTLVSPNQINLYVPSSAPTSGTAEFEVIQTVTGQVLAASQIQMNSVSPAIFVCPSTQVTPQRQACVLNQDGTLNGPTSPAARGSIIQIYGTGQGVVPNSPPDGTPPTGQTQTQGQPRVNFNGQYSDEYPLLPGDPTDGSWIKYSGFSPGTAGLWQINAVVPMGVTAGNQVTLLLQLNNTFSFNPGAGYVTTIAVK
jgi:uncharacterized protein (TIGR03437 family)